MSADWIATGVEGETRVGRIELDGEDIICVVMVELGV